MKRAVLIARILLGLPLIVFGLNGLLHFKETPADYPLQATAFLDALVDSGYLFPLKSIIEVACGGMLVLGLFVPLALILFAPILVNIVAFHVYLDDPVNFASAGIGYVMLVLELFLAWAYGPSFRGVLAPVGRMRFDTE